MDGGKLHAHTTIILGKEPLVHIKYDGRVPGLPYTLADEISCL